MSKKLGSSDYPTYLPFGCHLLVYNTVSLEFDCTCNKHLLRGLLCPHFLIVYETSSVVKHHVYLYHPRWLLDPDRDLAEGRLVKVQNDPSATDSDLTAEQSSAIIKRAKKLLGPYLRGERRNLEPIATPAAQQKAKAEAKRYLTVLDATVNRLEELGHAARLQALVTDMKAMIAKV
jgi:hypothetical protein